MSRRIMENVPNEIVQRDLERYRQRAIELGATDARVITTDIIPVDERVRAKCVYPRCPWYGTNANCPPHATDIETVRRIINKYHYAILTRIELPGELMTETEPENAKQRRQAITKNYELVSKVESEAFYDGYHLALGLAAGPCKPIFCPDKECSALVLGQGCRNPLKARASMEGEGIDAYTLATRVGWDIYPVGKTTAASSVPHGTILGLVFIY